MIDFSKPMRVRSDEQWKAEISALPWQVVSINGYSYAVTQTGLALKIGGDTSLLLENIPEKPQPKVRYQVQVGSYAGCWQDTKEWTGGSATAWIIETDHGEGLPDDERYEYRREVVKP